MFNSFDGTIDVLDKSPDWDNEAGNQGYLQTDNNLDSESDNLNKNSMWQPNLGAESQVPTIDITK